MRFHLVSLPHTQTTDEYSACAYTMKVKNFARMMKSLGHEVVLYASEENEAPCDELVTVITKEEQREFFGENDFRTNFFNINWATTAPHWKLMNERVIDGISERAEPQDFVCLIAGVCQKPIAEALPNLFSVEFGIGYKGVFSKFRVFESYAWMHWVLGNLKDDNGHFYDAVIPPYLDPDDFTVRSGRGEYHLYIGRLIDRKGWRIAVEATERAGEKLVMAGQVGDGLPDLPSHVTHVGYVDPARRRELLSGAKALWMPTQYIEPGGNVHIEAFASGVPVIATDWGVASETVIPYENGFRCRTLAEFVAAIEQVEHLNPLSIAKMSRRYWLESVALQYQAYFRQLDGLWREGWYEERDSGEIDFGRYL